ncbi:MAG: hypothetical protein ABW292_00215, partial [Vicinamibacterales bacterium]
MNGSTVGMLTLFLSTRPRRARRPRGRLWKPAAALTVVLLSSGPVVIGQSALRGVYLLPVGNRASVVVELETAGGQATVVEATDAATFVVDIGPVTGPVAAQLLRAAPSAPLVREVVVSGTTHSTGGTLVRVQVALRSAVAGSIRVADRRVYIDLAPRNSRPPSTPLPPSPAPQIADRQESDEELLARARALASVPNVKGLIDLRTRVIGRRGDTGTSESAAASAGNQLLERIDQYLAEAQKLQLAKDSQLFQRAQRTGEYRSSLQQAALELDAIDRALGPASLEATTVSLLHADSVQLAARLRAIEAPSDLTTAHRQLCEAIDALAAALAREPAENN